MARPWLMILLLCVMSAPGAGAAAQLSLAGGDFDTDNAEWNGMSELVAVAAEEDAHLEVVSRLDLGTLTPADGLLVVHPSEELPTDALSAFMRAGGRMALADDFGAGDSLFRVFRIGRGAPNTDGPSVLRLRGNPQLLVARPMAPHPLCEGVGSIVTNHPRVLFHADLEPIYAVGDHDAVVLAGAVGQGRLVAVGDPSILINNMLELAGNRRFASNLLLYLRGSGDGRVFVVPPGAVLVGRYGEPGSDRPLHDLRAALERASEAELPPAALWILSIAVVLILLIILAGVLPRTSPYRADAMFRDEPVAGGLSGRLEWYRGRPGDLLEPTLVYKLELEALLSARLGLRLDAITAGKAGRRVQPDEIVTAMLTRGLTTAACGDARRLLDELAGLASGSTNGTAPPVTEARFRNLVSRGDALLAVLGAPPAGSPLSSRTSSPPSALA